MQISGKWFIALVCMLSTALILQGAFDTSDHEKSERIVRSYRGRGGPSIDERVHAAAPGGSWSTEITRGCRGIVRVGYHAPGASYEFDYDVPQHGIHPANPAAEAILNAIPKE